MEELQAKLMQKTEDLMEMHKKQSEAQGKVAELTGQLRKKEEEISKRDERCRFSSSSIICPLALCTCAGYGS